jgi:hypothetical protein
VSLCSARSRHEVLCFVSVGIGNRWGQSDSAAGQKPESECLRGTMGPLGQTGMPVQSDPVRRGSAVACPDRVRPTLSQRKKPSRERQPTTLPRFEQRTTFTESRDCISSPTRWPAQILQTRRMNILTKRDWGPPAAGTMVRGCRVRTRCDTS